MTIAMFGYKLSVPTLQDPQEAERIVAECAKKSDERQLLLSFVRQVLPELFQKISTIEISSEQTQQVNREAVIEFYLAELKARQNFYFSVYDDLVLGLILQRGNLTIQKYIADLRSGKPADIPAEFPSHRKYADSVVVGKLRGDIGEEEVKKYLRRRELIKEIKQISQDMFFAINNGLNKDESLRFMGLLYELRDLQTELPVNFLQLRKCLLSAIRDREEISLVHVKCLRFVYPKSGGIEILSDTGDVVVDGVGGKYLPKSESNLFSRLEGVKNVFEKFGVKTRFTVCCSDEDLRLLFPPGGKYLTDSQSATAYRNAEKYISCLKIKYGGKFYFNTINELTANTQGRYLRLRGEILNDLHKGSGKFVNPDYFERDRVGHQYNYYQQLLGSDYSREEARRSIAEQTASVVALSEILRTMGDGVILVEENRYGENKLIAGGKFPIIFIKLRDEAKFDIE